MHVAIEYRGSCVLLFHYHDINQGESQSRPIQSEIMQVRQRCSEIVNSWIVVAVTRVLLNGGLLLLKVS